jgi:hypothetical protein
VPPSLLKYRLFCLFPSPLPQPTCRYPSFYSPSPTLIFPPLCSSFLVILFVFFLFKPLKFMFAPRFRIPSKHQVLILEITRNSCEQVDMLSPENVIWRGEVAHYQDPSAAGLPHGPLILPAIPHQPGYHSIPGRHQRWHYTARLRPHCRLPFRLCRHRSKPTHPHVSYCSLSTALFRSSEKPGC